MPYGRRGALSWISGLRHQRLRRFPLHQQPIHVLGVDFRIFGVARVFVARRTAREEAAFRRVRAGIRAVADTVAVDVDIAAELLDAVEIFGVIHLAAVVTARVVPHERIRHHFVHAEFEVGHDDDRRLQPIGDVERVGRKVETLLRRRRNQHHVFAYRRAMHTPPTSGRPVACASACRWTDRRAARR